MTLLVTAATGHLGRLVVSALLERGTSASDIVAGVRTPGKAADLAARGVRVVELDYSRPETLAPAFAGVDRVLLISGTDADRVAGHRNVVNAAAEAGVERLVYTSAPRVDEIDYALGADHLATEQAIAASGVSATILRHNWYTENYLDAVARAAGTGEIVAAVAGARVASASRRDYAEAAAVALTTDDLAGRSEEHTSELQSPVWISYAVFCLKMNCKLVEIVYLSTTHVDLLWHKKLFRHSKITTTTPRSRCL